MTANKTSYDITRVTLAVICLGILIAGCYMVLKPFLAACFWATMIVVATWPLLLLLQEKLRGRRGVAVAIMVAALLLIFVIPFWLAIDTIVTNSETISSWIKEVPHLRFPRPPHWVENIPLAGPRLSTHWNRAASADTEALAVKLTPYLGQVFTWFLTHIGGFGLLFVHFLLTVVLAAILYTKGETVAYGVRLFARRLGGEGGEGAVILAAKSVRAVALGIVLTALAQALLAGFGFGIAGIPFSFLLTALVFMSAIIQTGAPIITIPTAIWLFWQGQTGWGIFMLIWTVPIGIVDNFLRPVLIRKGADLPLLLIFGGVIGGLLSFGIIGLFIGPVVLAVTYTLLRAWVLEGLTEKPVPR